MLKVMEKEALRKSSRDLFELDKIALAGARRMLMAALTTEAADYMERHRHERDAEDRALVVHNGRSKERKLTLGAGTVEPKAPRVNDRRHDEQGQRRALDFRPALEGLVGADATGLSPTNISRLTACWEKNTGPFASAI
jgi:putative transposase